MARDGRGKRGRTDVIPLGGVGEVGKNATVLEAEGRLVLVDCGVQFPAPEQHGVDLIIPDFSYLLERRAQLDALVLTHAHEDHIGAVPFLLRQLGSPLRIYGTPLTLGLVSARLEARPEGALARLHQVPPGGEVRVGPFHFNFVPVGHSIPEATALLVETPAGPLFFTGDFKFDDGDEEGLNRDRLRELRQRQILVLFSDCVRVETPGNTPGEAVVVRALDRIIGAARGRVIVATFASNLARLRAVLEIAARRGRHVAVAGRGMETSVRVAREQGYLNPPPGLMIELSEVEKLPGRAVLILATGSQGEPAAALARMAAGEHPQIAVGPGDTVIVSASPIPGNEESVARTIDGLFRRGADVVYRAVEPDVHVSGHAAREDLGDLIQLLAPRYCVPLHGEYRMMVLYQRLAASRGVPAERVIFPEIGGRLVIANGRVEQDGYVQAGDVLVDGLEIGGIDEAVLRDRRHLAEDGVVIISVAVAGESGELLTSPEVVARGVAQREMAGPVLEAARAAVERALRRLEPNETDISYLERRIREVARSVIRQQSGRRPLVLPIVTEV